MSSDSTQPDSSVQNSQTSSASVKSRFNPASAKRTNTRRRNSGQARSASQADSLPTPKKSLQAKKQEPDRTVSDKSGTSGNRPSENIPESQEKSKRKSRRGRRGGKGRSHHLLQQEAQGTEVILPASPVEIAAHLMQVIALPPGKPARGRRKKAAVEQVARPIKRMLISVLQGEQIEVGIAEDDRLLEYYLEMLHQRKIKGNIYKGVVHNIDTNLQAAFINYGSGKNGFLQIDQIHPDHWSGTPEAGRKLPPIQKVLKIGQEILVQVVKEPAGSKGAFLTTWISLAGRFLVLTPGQEQIGVSRKVTEPEERARLRDMMNGIDPGRGFGVIVRTVGEGANKTTLKNDLQYLKRLWKDIRKKAAAMQGPALVHQEPGLPERSVRDYLTEDVSEIWVDNAVEAEHVRAMAGLLFPRKKDLVHLFDDPRTSLWDKFGLKTQLEQIFAREVGLPSGGRLVFDQTEALMAIDINSGKISGKNNFEAMAFKTNMEASEAIAHQLRLRDVGGQVVIDFIEMRDKKHVVEVEKSLRQAMKPDRARHDIARMSSFGLLELVRQRMGSSALSICMETCEACGGTGLRRNLEWQALQALRDMRTRMRSFSGPRYIFETERELGMYMLNHKRDALRSIEEDLGRPIEIRIRF